MDLTGTFTIQVLSEKTEVSPETLRYYERAGLMLEVARSGQGYRVYSDDHVRWVQFLRRLRESGMPIARVREYVALVRSGGDRNKQKRLALLREHRDDVGKRVVLLTRHLEILDAKLRAGCEPADRSTTAERTSGRRGRRT